MKPEVDQELSVSDLETLVRSSLVKNSRIIVVTGGEPFLRKDIDGILMLLKKNTKSMLSVISNGLLSKRILSTFSHMLKNDVRVDKISLSLNGRPETHDLTRGVPGSYNRVMETVHGLKRMKVYCSLLFTITKENYDQIEWADDLSRSLGVDISFYPEVDSYRFGMSDDERGFTNVQKAEILRQLKKIYDSRRFYYFDDTSLLFTMKALRGEPITPCYGGLQSAFVNWDGEVYACEGFNEPRFSFGNIKEEAFDDIFVSEKAAKMRTFIKDGKCQPCFLGCEILSSLRKQVLPMIGYTLKNRILKRGKRGGRQRTEDGRQRSIGHRHTRTDTDI
jgi:MoaA/NifB/PqqE/SkfB family radical SAM enzyme